MDLMAERGIRLRREINPYIVGWQGDEPEEAGMEEDPVTSCFRILR